VITDEAGNDAIAIRPIMNLTLTYDHRVVDGAYGAQFLNELREKLETWDESAY
jgi:pyruvate/2-oxoglutarate dehydrogenase complex dihydrolipoamide acyltransferase (E2) component